MRKLIVILLLIIYSCNKSTGGNLDELEIAKEVIQIFFQEFDEENKSYIVNPFYSKFELNSDSDNLDVKTKEKFYELMQMS